MSQPYASPPGQGDPGVQLLTPDGVRVDHPGYELDISTAELQGLYRDMVLVRRFDAEATALQRQGELGLWASLLGQEAAQIGSGRALRPEDFAFSSYREHGVAWCRGIPPTSMLRFWRGSSHGGWDPRAAGMGNYTVIIGAQALHAVGYAMGIQRDQQLAASSDPAGTEPPAAVIAYYGDGASSEGDVHESMVFASSYKAPVVFFCQNNHWAISVPSTVQTRIPLSNRAKGYGFPGIRVDGNDVIAVHAVTEWALDHARQGNGPVLIEAFTYRVGAHTTADDPTKYRQSAEEDAWRAKDPLARLEKYLRSAGLSTPWAPSTP